MGFGQDFIEQYGVWDACLPAPPTARRRLGIYTGQARVEREAAAELELERAAELEGDRRREQEGERLSSTLSLP